MSGRIGFRAAVLVGATAIGLAFGAPTQPERMVHSDRATAGVERVTFPSRDADLHSGTATMVTGVMMRPAGDGPFRAMVLLHGCAGLFQPDGAMWPRDLQWASKLVGLGYLVLLPDSFDPRGVPEICRRAQTISPAVERARDAYGALVYLQQQPFVRPDSVGLLGWSNGAMSVLSTIRTVQPARPPLPKDRDFRLAFAFYPACAPYVASAGWSTRTPLTILIGESDDWTPAAPCRELAERVRQDGGDVTLVTYPDAFHDFDVPDEPLRTLHGLTTTANGEATVGTNPTARADALARIPSILDSLGGR